ncbi:MAG: hypothetical protein P8N23_05960 [Methylophilaceae bacterium]|nr:hypothetical protein [Methylophilaceae bacterium]
MRIELNEKIRNALMIEGANDDYLRQVLRYGFWNYKEAINYLLGVFKLNPCNSQENTVITLSGETITETENSDLILYLQLETERLFEIWEHSGFDNDNPPAFYIEWAKTLDFEPIWADYSLDKKLIQKEPKPLSNRERDTLLIIIAALAQEAEINIEKTSKYGENIAQLTQQMGCPVGATTIEEKLKLIPDALESRAK